MEYRQFGKTDMKVSVLGFGGSPIGFRETPQADIDALLNHALDLGLNAIDTAECYMDSEEKIGRAVSHRRSDFYLFTKCGHASGFPEADWDPGMLAKQIDRSLHRLNTDHLDLVQLHSCSLEILQQGAVIEVLRQARDAGKTRYIGYSGDREAALWAVESGHFDALQTSVNLFDQQCIDLYLRRAQEAGIGVIAKRPLGNVTWLTGMDPSRYSHDYWDRHQKLAYAFLQGPEAASIALRFTLAQPGVCTAIVGTTEPARYAENVRILEAGPLSPEDAHAIRQNWMECVQADWHGMT